MQPVTKLLCLVGLALLLCGCRGSSPTPTSATAPPADPDAALHEQIRSGAIQLTAALDTIHEALDTTKKLKSKAAGVLKVALSDIEEYVDSAGNGIAEFAVEPQTLESVKKDFKMADDARLKAISTANDCRQDLLDALDIADEAATNGPKDARSEMNKLADLLDTAATDVEDAIKALGGVVEDSADEEDTTVVDGEPVPDQPATDSEQKPK
jgi:hypothetical protein